MPAAFVFYPADGVMILTEKRHGIAAGHKIARHAVVNDQPIRKFGQIIGYASASIDAGQRVHTARIVP